MGACDRGKAVAVAADQQQAGHQSAIAEREAAFIDDGNQGIRQMLRRADAAGRAVHDDPDRLGRHGERLCYAGRAPVHGESKVPRHIVCLTFDFDTQSGFIARGMTTPTPLSRGEFGLVGARRILALLKSFGLRATWFVPGFTIESHPRACEALLPDGHEVAHHSWAHIPPAQQTRAEEEADLLRANDAIARLTGHKARGYRSPSWDLSESTIDLLLAHGFLYDSSLMASDLASARKPRSSKCRSAGRSTIIRTSSSCVPPRRCCRACTRHGP